MQWQGGILQRSGGGLVVEDGAGLVVAKLQEAGAEMKQG